MSATTIAPICVFCFPRLSIPTCSRQLIIVPLSLHSIVDFRRQEVLPSLWRSTDYLSIQWCLNMASSFPHWYSFMSESRVVPSPEDPKLSTTCRFLEHIGAWYADLSTMIAGTLAVGTLHFLYGHSACKWWKHSNSFLLSWHIAWSCYWDLAKARRHVEDRQSEGTSFFILHLSASSELCHSLTQQRITHESIWQEVGDHAFTHKPWTPKCSSQRYRKWPWWFNPQSGWYGSGCPRLSR